MTYERVRPRLERDSTDIGAESRLHVLAELCFDRRLIVGTRPRWAYPSKRIVVLEVIVVAVQLRHSGYVVGADIRCNIA